MKNRLAAAAALATFAVIGLAGCGSSDSASTDSAGSTGDTPSAGVSTPADAGSDAASDAPSAGAAGQSDSAGQPSDASGDQPQAGASTAPAPAKGSPISLGAKTVKDSALGNTIVFEQVVRDFPIPAEYSAMSDNELVLVKVKVTAGSKFYMTLGQSDFEFGVEGSDYPGQQNSADGITKAMKAAGYTPLADVEEGKSGEGWVPGYVRPIDSGKAYIAYHRLSYSTSTGGKIPEKTWKVTLPTS